ncbi:MAG: hypothetical protein AB7F59_13280 [Bdellovibrionales bacterium]
MSKFLFPFVIYLMATSALASGEISTDMPSNREAKKVGVGLSVGNPFPSLIGLNASYNMNDFLRARVGYGEIEATTGISSNGNTLVSKTTKVTTYGAGATAFVPGMSFSPIAGLAVSHVAFEGDGELEIQGVKKSGTLFYGSVGVDWLASSGFNAGLGYHIGISQAGGSMYADLGWFF